MPEQVENAVARLLSMVSWIGDHPGVSVNDVAFHFDRSVRQVKRDVQTLGEIGDSLPGASFEIDWDLYERESRLTLRTTMGVDTPPHLTEQEAAAIIIGLQAIAPGLTDELSQRLPHTVLAVESLVEDGKDIRQALAISQDTQRDDRVGLLMEAISHDTSVSFMYPSSSTESTSKNGNPLTKRRVVQPWFIHCVRTGWQMQGWCSQARETRVFAINRMYDIRLENASLHHPAPSATDTVNQCDAAEENEKITLTCSNIAQWVIDTIPCRYVSHDQDSFTVDLPVWNRRWVEGLLIDLGDSVKNVSPDSWNERKRLRARQALDVWDEIDDVAYRIDTDSSTQGAQ